MSPLYGKEPEVGLHRLKDAWKQKKHFGPQSLFLADRLDAAIVATFDAAPVRKKSFQLSRDATEGIHDSEQERRLEAAMLQRWNRPDMSPITNGWNRLIAFQVPLFDQQQKNGWGYVDLLGMNSIGLPVVVELKKGPYATPNGRTNGSETPLRMVLEAAAYAIALRKNWLDFRVEWLERLTDLGVSGRTIARVPAKLNLVPLVAAAPASFWIDWLPVTAKGGKVDRNDWMSFNRLLAEFKKALLPVTFVSISGHDQDVEGLAIQPLEVFPLC